MFDEPEGAAPPAPAAALTPTPGALHPAGDNPVPHALPKLALLLCLSLSSQPSVLLARQAGEHAHGPKFAEVLPAGGTVVAAREVTIKGRVEHASPVEVSVYGDGAVDFDARADAAGRFSVPGVPLRQGLNEFNLVARDADGNSTEFALALVGKDLTPPAAPTVFAVKPVTRLPFQLVEGRAEPGARVVITGGEKPVVVDAAHWTGLFGALVRLREGENELTVFAADDAGTSPSVNVSIERTGARPLRDGEPAQINISSGGAQRALPGRPYARPLVALVTDRRGRPVPGVPVEFIVRHGDARFTTGARFRAMTDANGHVSATLSAGQTYGIQLVRADFPGNTSSPASFDVQTVGTRVDGLTSVSGLLLDYYAHPLAGVPVRLGDRAARTGRDGRFRIERAAPGPGQRLEVFGDDIKAGEGRWSDASYLIDVLPGVDNELGRPLFASPLNDGPALGAGPPYALDAGGHVTTEGVVLAWRDDYGRDRAPEVTVRRGVRVTSPRAALPGGLKFSATLIDKGRVPVTLDDGLATGLYLFVRPRGVEFDRPLPVRLPNLDGLAPGTPLMIMRYDAQAGRWVRDGGGARVSRDGQAVESDEGSGIRGGGWHAFAGERTYAEFTSVNYIQVEGDPDLEGKDLRLEVSSGGKSAVMMSWWGEGGFKRLHFRVTMPALGDDVILGRRGMAHGDSGREVEVTVTPSGQALAPGEMVILTAVGRPHPGGYYVWASSDPSVASVVPFVSEGGGEHPNRAKVVAHRPGRAKVTALYVTSGGATSAASAEVVCRPAQAP